MNIFQTIPEEVMEDSILTRLGWNDLLRFRRVSKASKVMTNRYLQLHPELAPEIEIKEQNENRSFGAFLRMNIPTARIYLNNPSGSDLYGSDGASEFLDKFGPMVKHLRVEQLSLHIHGKEWDLFDALVNLESLEAAHFGYGGKVNSDEELRHRILEQLPRQALQDGRYLESRKHLPKIFERLKSLKIGHEPSTSIPFITQRICDILDVCWELDYLALPMFQNWRPATLLDREPYPGDGRRQGRWMCYDATFRCIWYYINRRAWLRPDKPNLKIFDFCNYHDKVGLDPIPFDLAASTRLPELAKSCVKYGVLLQNVSAMWFQRDICPCHGRVNQCGMAVGSLVGYHSYLDNADLRNLSRIEIRSTARKGSVWYRRREYDWRPNWFEGVHSLDITVDSKRSEFVDWSWNPREDQRGAGYVYKVVDTKDLFCFFFESSSITNLTDLCLNFAKEAGFVAVPKTEMIVRACPNLKKLTIGNWPGTNKALLTLFEGLVNLEEICLDRCKKVGNVTFVGLDTGNPILLRLPKLKRLALKGLDQMPKITDLLFSLVIRHLKLSHLTLTSDAPLTSVTAAGVGSLLEEGHFANWIEKFHFTGWSLDKVPAEEFKKLEAKFRSYNML